MQDTTTLIYQDIPQNKLQAKMLNNWSGMDAWVFFTIMLILIASGVWLHAIGQNSGSFLIVLFEALMLLPLIVRLPKGYGRLYDEIVSGLRGEFRQQVLHGIWWRQEDTDSRFIRWLRYRHNKHGVIPLKLVQIQAKVDGEVQRFGVLRQLDRPFDHLYIRSRGGAFASVDANRNHQAVTELANITNLIIAQAGLKLGISYLRITGPCDETKPAQFLAENMNPLIAEPDLFDLDDDTRAWADWLREDANQLRPTARTMGASETWYLIIITIKRSREWRRASKGKLSDEQLNDLPIIELGRSMVEALDASTLLELEDVHCVGLAELSTLVRCAWDVAGIDSYYRDRAAGRIPRTDEDIDRIRNESGSAAVDAALQTWPTTCIETPATGDCIKVDGNYISTLRVTALPERVRADQYLGLHYIGKAGSWNRMAMVGQSVSGNAETRNLVIGQSALVNLQAALFSNRVVQNPRWGNKRRKMADQAQEMSAHSISQQFNQLHSAVATSQRELKRNLRQLSAALNADGFPNEVVKVPDRQLAALISGCLGINRL